MGRQAVRGSLAAVAIVALSIATVQSADARTYQYRYGGSPFAAAGAGVRSFVPTARTYRYSYGGSPFARAGAGARPLMVPMGRTFGGQAMITYGYPTLGRVVQGNPYAAVLTAPLWPPAGFVH
jgi:hypothetical protein